MKYYVVVVAFSLCSIVKFCKHVWVTRTSTRAHHEKDSLAAKTRKVRITNLNTR